MARVSMPPQERFALTALGLLLAYAAWVRGGTSRPLQGPLPWLGLLVFAAAWVKGRRRPGAGEGPAAPGPGARGMTADPVFYLGGAFLVLLLAQWWNAGRQMVFDFAAWRWIYTPPRVPWLPWAFDRGEAREMLCWFFPAWSVALLLRAGGLSRPAAKALYTFIAVNAALLAVFGIAQYLSGTTAIYWITELPVYFFASFGYSNHAGAYFILAFCVSAGLLAHELLVQHRPVSRRAVGLYAACALLAFCGAVLSLSLACILLAFGLATAIGAYVGLRAWRRLSTAQRFHLGAASVGAAALAVFLAVGVASASRATVADELDSLSQPDLVQGAVGKRTFLSGAACRIWKDHPWFGVGGWGFRYLLAMYVEPDQWRLIGRGRANVHNDPLQFLAEFGLVGAGLLAACAGVLGADVLRSGAWRHKLVHVSLAGVAVVLGYSLMDLPFRSPAILYAWVAVVAAMPGFVINTTPRQEGD